MQTAQSKTFQVTAIYMDAEVGYGEGDSYEWAANECAESVESIYPSDDVKLVCTMSVRGLPVTVETPLDLFREFAGSAA